MNLDETVRERLLSAGPEEFRDPAEIDLIKFSFRNQGFCQLDYFSEGSHMITDARRFPAQRVRVVVGAEERKRVIGFR